MFNNRFNLGPTVFNDVYELNYQFLTELEYKIMPDGIIIDPYKNAILAYNGNTIKASINENDIHYAGEGEVQLDLLNDLKMVTMLFGQYLEKKQAMENMPFISHFWEEKIDPNTDLKWNCMTVRLTNEDFVSSKYYRNKTLCIIDIIFRMEDEDTDLSNIDEYLIEMRESERKR